MRGYTLVELMVVLVIIAIISLIGFINYKSFAADQVTVKAVGQVQSLLRLAQSNATSSTLCNDNQNVGPWSLIFNQGNVGLACGLAGVQKTYTLENAQIDTIVGSDCGGSVIPLTLTYSNGVGAVTFAAQGSSPTCLASTSWTFTISNTKNPGSSPKPFSISKGGAIDVQ